MKMFQLRLSLEETISMSVIGFAGSKQLFTRHLKFKPHSSFKIKKKFLLIKFFLCYHQVFCVLCSHQANDKLVSLHVHCYLDDNTMLHVLWFWEADLIPMLIFYLCELIILSSVHCFTLNKLLTNSCYPRLADLLLYIL